MTTEALWALLAERGRGALVTLKRDGRPQISNVDYTFDPERRVMRISVTEGRAKTKNLGRDPRASFYVTTPDGSAYAVAEGTAQLSPVAVDPGDATVEELIDLYRAIQGEHPDWDDYRAAMVNDRRRVLRLPVDHIYGWSPSAHDGD